MLSTIANTSTTPAVYVPPAKRVLSHLSFRAPSTFFSPPPPLASTAMAVAPLPQLLGVASFPIPSCRKKTPLTRTLSAHSLLERQEEQEEAQVLTAIRVDAENPLWMVPLLDRVEHAIEPATPVVARTHALTRVVRASSPSPLHRSEAAAPLSRLVTIEDRVADVLTSAEFPTEKRRISIVTDLPTFDFNRAKRYLSPASAGESEVIDISRPSSRASCRSASSEVSSLFSAVSHSTAASSTLSSPISPTKALPGGPSVSPTFSPGSHESSDVWSSSNLGEESESEQEVALKAAEDLVKNYLYAGGKTNVLGGGVMLGVTTKRNAPSTSRRSALFSALQGRLRARA